MAHDDRDLRPEPRRPDDRSRYADGAYRTDDRDERGFVDRATDEVRTWFGDDDAERRRARDERDDRGYDARDYGRRERTGDYDRFAERRRQSDEGGRSGFRGYAEGGMFTGRRTDSGNDYARGYISDESESRFDGGSNAYGRAFRPNVGGFGPDQGRESRREAGGTRGGGADDERRESFRGRGPQGYSRSTERITEDVNEALHDDHDVDASGISVSVENGEVTLSGTVSSRREKRLAEQIAEHARGVRDVHNRLRVQDGTTTVGTSSAPGTGADAGSLGVPETSDAADMAAERRA